MPTRLPDTAKMETVLPKCPPRIMSAPPSLTSLGREAVELGASAGVHLDDWQAFALEISMGLRADGKWAAFEVAINVARQNGKNEIAVVRELAGLFLLNERLLIHSAHEFKTSTEHQRRLEEVIQDNPEMHKRVTKNGYKHSHGQESIELRNGQRIRFMTRTKGGGRGHTGDFVCFDEAMILPAAMIGALMPTMAARSVHGNPQLWYCFTAVDQLLQENGVVASRLRDRAMSGDDPSLAYLEWSVDAATPDDVTPEMAQDVRLWGHANPALGIRISEEHVANEQRSMDPRTFAVERLGAGDYPAPDGTGSVFDLAVWNGLAVPADGHKRAENQMLDPVALAFEVSQDRKFSAICAAGLRPDGSPQVEVIQRRAGTGWVAARLLELDRTHSPRVILCGGSSPAKSLLPEIEALGVKVETTSTREDAEACGMFFDAVEQERLRHLGTPDLDAAIRLAAKRTSGDAFVWDRRGAAGDIGTLVGCTLALWGVSVQPTSVYEERGLLIV